MNCTHVRSDGRPVPTRVRPQRGFTLVELMVGIALGLFLVVGLLALLVSNTHSRSELDNSARQIENGRYAIQLLTEDLQHAGFNGGTQRSGFTEVAPTACATAVADLGYTAVTAPGASSLPASVGGLPANPACVTDRKANTAMLLLTRVSTVTTTVAAAKNTEAYLQVSSCGSDSKPFAMTTGAGPFPLLLKDCATVAPLRKVIQRIYFVSTCNECGTDTMPTLKMVDLVDGANTITPLVEGVDDLQFDYGVDTDNDGAPDCYTSNPTAPGETTAMTSPVCPTPAVTDPNANWRNVVGVRVHVLARNNSASAAWQEEPNKTYEMGLAKADSSSGAATVGGYTDRVKRRAYSAVARFNNVSGQREAP